MSGKKTGSVQIGTSGWGYNHWKGTFYPEGLSNAQEFPFYTTIFKTVEINNSFYRLPTKTVFENWKNNTPDDFVFAVKGSRFITHMKKLLDPEISSARFFDNVSSLQPKLGPILFQLPPRWKINVERLAGFLKVLPPRLRYTFEFRDHSWYADEITRVLETFNAAFCIYELDGHLSPQSITADFVYVRLHGPAGKYQGSYDDKTLEQWATKIKEWKEQQLDVFVYFDNDQNGFAPQNARKLLDFTC